MAVRSVVLAAALALIASCGDPGPRDRSLKMERNRDLWSFVRNVQAKPPEPRAPTPPPPSIIGLVSDPLAPFYPDEPALVVRFEPLEALDRAAAPHFKAVRDALPELNLPSADAEALLRAVTGAHESVVFDPLRPFAFVKTPKGWIAIAAARDTEPPVEPTAPRRRSRAVVHPLDGVYAAIGHPNTVEAFEPARRAGFCLPGLCSVIATPEAAARIGAELSGLVKPLGLDLSFLDAAVRELPRDLARVDVALRFDAPAMRLDARFAPERDSATSLLLERLRLAHSSSMDWLPRDGTLYAELGIPALDWEALAAHLTGLQPAIPEDQERPLSRAVRRALNVLDNDVAVLFDVDPDGTGRLFLVASLRKPELAREFLGSPDFFRLLSAAAGPEGHLEYTPGVIADGDTRVGSITGHMSRERLQSWRNEGLLASSVGLMLRGPLAAYVAIVEDKLCVLVARQERSEAKRFTELLRKRSQPGSAHVADVDSLLHQRLASFSVDLAALYDGCRRSAPLWHEHGDTLRDLRLRWRIPVSGAIGVEGGALRVALRLPPDRVADAVARFLGRIRKAAAEAAEAAARAAAEAAREKPAERD